MTKINIQEIVENLLDTFLYAGKVSLELRDQGLTKELKSDNTPVFIRGIDNFVSWFKI